MVVNWRICSLGECVLHSVKHSRARDGLRGTGGGQGWQPSTDERTGTRGCGEVPATKGDEVQRVLRVRIQGSRPGIMLTCIVSFMAITPIVSEREGLQ